MNSKKVILIAKKDALSKLSSIIHENDLCYYLVDDYAHYLKLQKSLPDGCQILTLASIFRDSLRSLRQPYLDLFGRLGEKHGSLAWWGTQMAAKNPASTPLLLNLVYLYSAKKILDDSQDRTIFIGESQALLDSIAKIAKNEGYHIVPPNRKLIVQYRLNLWFLYGVRITYFILESLKNKRTASILPRPLSTNQSGQKRVVIRTWVTGGAFNQEGEFVDRNFGVLPKWLQSQGYEVWTSPMFFNLPVPLKDMYNQMKAAGDHYLIPEHYLTLTDYLKVLYLGLKQLRISLGRIQLESMDVTLIFREVQLEQGFIPSVLTSCLIYHLPKKLRGLGIEIDKFYYPFENNLPEKPFILGIRRYYPELEIVGYQHTTWFPDQLAYYLSETETEVHPLPDKLIYSGPIYLKLIENSGFSNITLKAGPSLRFTSVYDSRVPESQDPDKPKVILLPLTFDNNLANELIGKVKLAIESLSNDYLICIRTHPLLSKNALNEFLEEIGLKEFRYVDDGILQDWLLKSFTVVSNGASITILESAAMGVPVIRLMPDNGFFYDPFAWSTYPLEPVHTATEIASGLSRISELLAEDDQIFRRIGKQTQFDYFGQVNENSLGSFL